MRAHQIENGVIVNTIEVNDLNILPNLVEATSGQIGWGYENGNFIEPARNLTQEWLNIRSNRNVRLLASDVYVLPDRWAVMTTEQQTAWSTYRQALRDTPTAFSDPADVVWPTQPE
jgi:hypothetical protein